MGMMGKQAQRIKGALATPMMRRLLRRPSHFVAREEIARAYIKGVGIEVGALDHPLRVPEAATVRYVDYVSDRNGVKPDLIADLETLSGIRDGSVDFVIANHVLEHVENPFRALVTIARVLAQHGVAYIVLPDKRFSFDRRRAVTPLGHIVRDHAEGPEWSRHDHYRDWAANVEGLRGKRLENRVAELDRDSANIHFHVWDFPAMRQMFDHYLERICTSMRLEHVRENRREVIWVLRKGEERTCARHDET